MIPVVGFLAGDTLGLVLLAHDDTTIGALAEMMRRAAEVRVAVRGPLAVHHGGRVLDPALTVAEAGIGALERVDVRPEAP
jgi:hypothetical protein